jgi:hypothetical protein
VPGIALQDLVAVGDRFLQIAGQVVDRGAAVPAFGEVRFFRHDVIQKRDRFAIPPGLHFLGRLGHQGVDPGIARAGPQQPQAALGEIAHERAFVAQALVEQRRVGHAAAVGDPHHRLGARRRIGIF